MKFQGGAWWWLGCSHKTIDNCLGKVKSPGKVGLSKAASRLHEDLG